jgi:polar amino acid transport system substrate-binding protein
MDRPLYLLAMQQSRRFLALLVPALGFILLMTSQPTLAGELPACPPEPISLSYLEYGNMYYMSRGNVGTGIDADIIAELARRSGCKFKTMTLTRARTWLQMRDQHLDMTTSALVTPEREEYAWFIPYIGSRHDVLLGPAAAQVRTLVQFEKKKDLFFGQVRGYHHTPFYDEKILSWKKQGRVKEYVNESALMSALKNAEIAAVLSRTVVYRHYLDEDDLKKITLVDWEPGSPQSVIHLMFAKHRFSQAEVDKWRALTNAMIQDGSMFKIINKYLPADEARKHMLNK